MAEALVTDQDLVSNSRVTCGSSKFVEGRLCQYEWYGVLEMDDLRISRQPLTFAVTASLVAINHVEWSPYEMRTWFQVEYKEL